MRLDKNKKIILGICAIICIFVFVIILFNKTFALKNNRVLIECNNSDIAVGDSSVCSLKLEVDGSSKIFAISLDINVGNGLTLERFDANDTYKDYTYLNNNKLVIGSRDGIDSDSVLGNLVFKASSLEKVYKISLDNVNISNQDDEIVSLDNVSKSLDAKVSNPKTGVISIIFVFIMIGISIACFIYFFKKYKSVNS